MEIRQRAVWVTIFTAGLLAASLAPNGRLRAAPASDQTKVLAQLESYARSSMEKWGTPGMAIAVVKDDKIVYAKGFGVKSVGGHDPVDANTVFQIGSTSKAFTSALMAMQVDAGKVKWSDRVIDHLPGFVMYDPWVTREFQVRDLMAPYVSDSMAEIGFSARDIVAKLGLLKPVSSFRTEFAYVNNLFLVAGELIEKSSGHSWAENLREQIFTPLGMKSSSSDQASFVAARNRAAPHKLVNGKLTAFPADIRELSFAYTYGPAGGINSSVTDMAQWIRLLLGHGTFAGKRLISAKNLDYVMSPQTIIPQSSKPGAKTHPQSFYCEGWMYTAGQPQPLIWHNGDTNFMHAAIGIIPGANTGIVVLTNASEQNLADAVMMKYYDLVCNRPATDWSGIALQSRQAQQKAARAPFANRPKAPAPALAPAHYAGTFTNPVYGKLSVEKDGQNLKVILGPAKLSLELTAWNHDTFVASRPKMDEFFGNSGFATFTFGSDGKVASVILSEFSDVDHGVFTRLQPRE
jgi:CubicO group peptidase (beta-lactamase class C family)